MAARKNILLAAEEKVVPMVVRPLGLLGILPQAGQKIFLAVKQKLVLSGGNLPFVVTMWQKTICLPSRFHLLVAVLKELV